MGRLHLIEMVLSEPELEGSGGNWQVDPRGREFEAVQSLKGEIVLPIERQTVRGGKSVDNRVGEIQTLGSGSYCVK